VLPFLKKHAETEESSENMAIHSCAEDLISAIHAHDIKAAAEAMKSAFEILDSAPEHIEPHSYDAQKER
jgi:hypothetical protein